MASYQCDRCLKQFSSYYNVYNVRRHTANHCAYANIDDNASMEGAGGSSYSDEQSVDSFPDEELRYINAWVQDCKFKKIY